MADEIVKFNNDMNTVALRKFNSTEIDLLMAICSRIREKDTKIVEFDFHYLKKLVKFPYDDTKTFAKYLDKTYTKLIECHIRIGNDVKWTRFVLFTKYTVDIEKQIISIGVNEEFKYVLNELTANFTRFELDEFINFKSTYTKEFYRRMKQFRYTGFWKCSLEEFRRYLDIPVAYEINKIDSRILKPIMEELGKEYNLKIKKKYGKTQSGRGRSKVIGFEFKFGKMTKKTAKKEMKEIFGDNEIFNQKEEIKIIDAEKAQSYVNRKVKMYDKTYDRYNYLNILYLREMNGKLIVKLKNVDDGYLQDFEFENFKNFENWFNKYEI